MERLSASIYVTLPEDIGWSWFHLAVLQPNDTDSRVDLLKVAIQSSNPDLTSNSTSNEPHLAMIYHLSHAHIII